MSDNKKFLDYHGLDTYTEQIQKWTRNEIAKIEPEEIDSITEEEINALLGAATYELKSASVAETENGLNVDYLIKETAGEEIKYIQVLGLIGNFDINYVTLDSQEQVDSLIGPASYTVDIEPKKIPSNYEIIPVSEYWHDWRYETTVKVSDDVFASTLTGYAYIDHVE